jgi:hypothetical protein
VLYDGDIISFLEQKICFDKQTKRPKIGNRHSTIRRPVKYARSRNALFIIYNIYIYIYFLTIRFGCVRIFTLLDFLCIRVQKHACEYQVTASALLREGSECLTTYLLISRKIVSWICIVHRPRLLVSWEMVRLITTARYIIVISRLK